MTKTYSIALIPSVLTPLPPPPPQPATYNICYGGNRCLGQAEPSNIKTKHVFLGIRSRILFCLVRAVFVYLDRPDRRLFTNLFLTRKATTWYKRLYLSIQVCTTLERNKSPGNEERTMRPGNCVHRAMNPYIV